MANKIGHCIYGSNLMAFALITLKLRFISEKMQNHVRSTSAVNIQSILALDHYRPFPIILIRKAKTSRNKVCLLDQKGITYIHFFAHSSVIYPSIA